MKEWVGLNLGWPQRITSIAFCPHTDDDEIIPGELYQLKHLDNGRWINIKEVVAEDYTLIFENVPRGALLWLRNLTKDQEERIFTYETVNKDVVEKA